MSVGSSSAATSKVGTPEKTARKVLSSSLRSCSEVELPKSIWEAATAFSYSASP